ncbi:zinc-binding dehydrogenase [Qaidamihabitans albus]|uniref:zinc-binding dehydrogenase n=1 Tax=Qaidamihabitans albus TaxID=2795733 RepID=UPI0018F1835A|nr:Zn-dependent alcohol dehydrogenase [Qaidamihabitans albus]
MTIEEIEIGELDPGEVLVRIGAAGLCHTDLEVISGQLAYPMPIVLGHEAAGTIEQVGAGVDPQRVGDQVVLSWNPHCGRCFHCTRGDPILCEHYVALGPKAVPFSGRAKLHLGGRPLHTMFYMSAFAEYAVVTDACAVPIPREVPVDCACLLGCGVLTGVGAATRIAGMRHGDTAMVIGCGAVGLSAVQGARLAGARQIVAVDLDDRKLATARLLGATHVVNARHEDPVVAGREITEGRGADCVVESAGSEHAFRASVEACRAGGRVVWLGKVGVNDEVAFRWGSLMGEKRFTRSSYGGAHTATDFPWLARSYLEGELKLDEMITQRLRLDDINSGFDDLRDGQAIRSVVLFDH